MAEPVSPDLGVQGAEARYLRIPPFASVTGWAGFCAACAGVVADLLLQFTPDTHRLGDLASVMSGLPTWRLYAGHYLGVAAALGLAAGVWRVSQLAQRRSRLASGLLAGGWLMAGAGAAFHSSAVFIGLLLNTQPSWVARTIPLSPPC